MRSKKLYQHVSLRELKKNIDQFDDDCTVEYFEIQVRKNHSVASTSSLRIGE
jgi:hypothetical protein